MDRATLTKIFLVALFLGLVWAMLAHLVKLAEIAVAAQACLVNIA